MEHVLAMLLLSRQCENLSEYLDAIRIAASTTQRKAENHDK